MSFNPCFGGNQKSNFLTAENEDGHIEFQSLFWWKSEIKSITSLNDNQIIQGVSILVLVEIRNQISNYW